MKNLWLGAIGAAALTLSAACGDSDGGETPTATATTAATTSATSAATGTASAETPSSGGVAMDPDFGEDGILSVPVSETGHDRFMAVATDDDGAIYATGFVNDGGDQAMVLAKFNDDGTPDTSFADGGVAIVNVASGGKTAELARGVAVLDDGKVVIGGPVEHDTSATGDAAKDTDIAILRFNPDGTLDGDFGDEGIAIVDLGEGKQVSENAFVGDNSWGLGAYGDGGAVVVATTLAEGDGRTDSDYVVFAVDGTGALDGGFGDAGRIVVDIDNASINPRNLTILDDGAVVATGYGNLGGVVQPVVVRIGADGQLDSGFGEGGVATATVLPGVAESYAVAIQGDSIISAGYGRGADSTEKVDMIVDRWTADGELDTSFGVDGVTRLDLAGQDDRARNVIVLPDNRILAVGSGKMTEPEVDAMIALFDQFGDIVSEFGTDGYALADLGGPNDAFYGVALSPDGESVIVAGYKGAATDGTDNDDAYLAKVLIGQGG